MIILTVYLAVVLFIELFFPRKRMKGEEFLKGDGTISWWITSISIFATLLSLISFLSPVENSYVGIWIMWFTQLGISVTIPITTKFFLPIYSKLNIGTAYHYLEIRLRSKGLRVLGAVMSIAYQAGRIFVITYLPSMVLPRPTGPNVNLLTIAMGVIAITCSYTGELKSVLWTGLIQGSVLLVGVTFVLFYPANGISDGSGVIFQAMGEGKLLAAGQPTFNPNILRDSVFLLVVGAGLNTCFSYVSSQDIARRFTTTTDMKKLNKVMLINGALPILIAAVSYPIGIGLYVFYSQNALPPAAQQNQIFTSYIAYELSVGITGSPSVAIYAASQFTLSTGLSPVAASWTLDIQECPSKKEMGFTLQTKVAQYVPLGVGIMAILVSMALANGEIKSVYEQFNGFMGLVLGVSGGTFTLDTFTRAANAEGVYATLFVAAVAMVCIKYMALADPVSIWSYSIISIIISLVVGIPVSMITRKMDGDIFKFVKDATTYHD